MTSQLNEGSYDSKLVLHAYLNRACPYNVDELGASGASSVPAQLSGVVLAQISE